MTLGSRVPSVLLRRLLLLGAIGLGGGLQAADRVVSPAYVNPLRNYGTEQGLPQASTPALLEGKDGYLWVGTLGGLARFDGRTFTTFRAGNEGIAGNRIQALYQDDQQRIWVGTQDAGISIYENGQFRKLDFCDGTCRINSLLPAGDGRSLWVRSSSGIFRMDIAAVKARPISQNNDVLDAMTALGNGQLYAGGRAGLFRFEEGKPDEKVALPAGSNSVRSMSSMRARYLWVITDSSRLYRYDPNESSWSLLAENLPATAQFVRNDDANVYLAGLPDTDIQQMHEDGSQTALSGTARIPQPRMLHTDAQGNRWVGTAAQGLWRLQTSRIGLFNDSALGLGSSGRALAEAADGGIWFGMNCGGLRHWDKNGQLQSVSLQAALDSECVYSLARDDHDRLWIGSVNGRLARLENGVATLAGNWPELREINIWKHPVDGRLWMSSLRETWQLKLDARGNVVERIPVAALHDVAVAWMASAQAGGTWFLGDNGLYRVQGDKVVEHWSAEQLGMRFLRGIHEDADGSLWLGSYGNGLVRIAEGKVQHYTSRDGLYDDTVSCILPDSKGRLWLGGNLGISLLAKPPGEEGEIAPAPLTSRDGLVPDELNGGSVSACLRDAHGRLWFSLLKGFAVIDPLAFTDEALAPPQVHIERLRVAGRNLVPESYVQLDGDVSNLGISYTAIDLANPDRLRFRYRLLPEGKEWVDAGDLRNVLLPSLPWGKFSFEVQARHTNGPWSPSATVQFQRPMPWFRMQWLWLILVLGGLLGMLWFMRDQH